MLLVVKNFEGSSRGRPKGPWVLELNRIESECRPEIRLFRRARETVAALGAMPEWASRDEREFW